MADFTADQVDLCLGEMVQDVAEDHVSASEVRLDTGACLPPVTILSVKNSTVVQAAATWAKSDSTTGEPAKHQRQHAEEDSDQPAEPDLDEPVLLQQPSLQAGHASKTAALPEQAELHPVAPEPSYPEEQEATSRVSEEYPEPLVNPAAGGVERMPDPSDRAAANLSKELRKLQAESAVLQEHSRRLQEKAAVVQQQRASADQVRQYRAACAQRSLAMCQKWCSYKLACYISSAPLVVFASGEGHGF